MPVVLQSVVQPMAVSRRFWNAVKLLTGNETDQRLMRLCAGGEATVF